MAAHVCLRGQGEMVDLLLISYTAGSLTSPSSRDEDVLGMGGANGTSSSNTSSSSTMMEKTINDDISPNALEAAPAFSEPGLNNVTGKDLPKDARKDARKDAGITNIEVEGTKFYKETEYYHFPIVWYAVLLCGLIFLAIRNRKQLEALSARGAPFYRRLNHVYGLAKEQAKKIPIPKVNLARIRNALGLHKLPSLFNGQDPLLNLGKEQRNSDVEMMPFVYEYVPQLVGYRISPILSKPVVKKLTKHLPQSIQMDDLKLLYSSNEHGALLGTFYEKAISRGPTLLIVKDESNSVFGAFIPQRWEIGFFGNGESFVFTISPEMRVYYYSGKNTTYVSAQKGHISIGGPRCALWLDEKLRSGMSEACDTFESPPLSRTPHFSCYGVELW
eukprot:CAMPEP_0197530734 /NCGR_PEP_ID=MMETSP1318-20131121/32746_1 /TAXON_ID=552666 /ORGANISM="Partenskyella glossopodia, Strain RCC365" /LENGTH=387 /DNA_ID=CAMNT_0043086679 /DNA_START=88 /DNA_END=1249 /DNA_ORIENTATION=-